MNRKSTLPSGVLFYFKINSLITIMEWAYMGFCMYYDALGWSSSRTGLNKPITEKWAGGDEEYRFNGPDLPKRWKYQNSDVLYRYNSHGFRCDYEFNEIDWSNTIVLHGCSFMHGTGLNTSDTIAHLLSKKLNMTVVNAAVSGSGVEANFWNILWFKHNYKPKLHIITWPYEQRILLHDISGFGPNWSSETFHINSSRIHRMIGMKAEYLLSPDHMYRMNRFKTEMSNYDNILNIELSYNEEKPDDLFYIPYHRGAQHWKFRDIKKEELFNNDEFIDMLNNFFAREVKLEFNRYDCLRNVYGHFGITVNQDFVDRIYPTVKKMLTI